MMIMMMMMIIARSLSGLHKDEAIIVRSRLFCMKGNSDTITHFSNTAHGTSILLHTVQYSPWCKHLIWP